MLVQSGVGVSETRIVIRVSGSLEQHLDLHKSLVSLRKSYRRKRLLYYEGLLRNLVIWQVAIIDSVHSCLEALHKLWLGGEARQIVGGCLLTTNENVIKKKNVVNV